MHLNCGFLNRLSRTRETIWLDLVDDIIVRMRDVIAGNIVAGGFAGSHIPCGVIQTLQTFSGGICEQLGVIGLANMCRALIDWLLCSTLSSRG